MKTTLVSMLAAIIIAFTTENTHAQKQMTVPQNVQNYIQKHFKGYNISHYEKERDLLELEHKVYVSKNRNTFKLEFNKEGKIKSIESTNEQTALPNSVLPVKITQYVKEHFPQTTIIDWKQKANTQVVELSNDIELIFSIKGNFLRIDD